jgi:hypothetical protein
MPSLAGSREEDLWFGKPLPDGKQKHVRIWLKRGSVKIEEHIDRCDPYRNPLGHLFLDVVNPAKVPHNIRYLSTRPTSRRKQRSDRSERSFYFMLLCLGLIYLNRELKRQDSDRN